MSKGMVALEKLLPQNVPFTLIFLYDMKVWKNVNILWNVKYPKISVLSQCSSLVLNPGMNDLLWMIEISEAATDGVL